MTPQPASPRRIFDERLRLLTVLADVLGCAAAVLLAYALRSLIREPFLAHLRHDITMYVRAIPVVCGLWLITFYVLGLYDRKRFASPVGEMTATFRAVTVTTLMVAAASFLSHQDYSRATLFFFWAAALVLSVASRALLRSHAERTRARGQWRARALVIGSGDLAQLVAGRIRDRQFFGYEFVGLVAVEEGPQQAGGYPVLGALADLRALVEAHAIDEILVAHPGLNSGALLTAVDACGETGVEFHMVAGAFEVLSAQSELSGPADLPVIDLIPSRFRAWQVLVKRLLDVLVSAPLLVLCAPMMLIIAWLIRRESRASAIFAQRRIGYRGAEFTMYKFRTMQPAADPYAESPSDPEDDRITRIGRRLRRSSLDELPQLFNVLKGNMSLVGPRPEMPFLVAQYEPWQRRRLDVKPGITGLWQVLGRKDLPLRDNIEYDFYYIRNWSIWLDLSLLLRTIAVVLGHKGAY